MNQLLFLLSTVISPETATATEEAAASSPGLIQSILAQPGLVVVIYCVVIFGLIFFMGRPDRKKQKAEEAAKEKIKPGDPVVLKSGIYGTIVDVTADCFIVEFGTNKGVRIPVMKEAIGTIREPNLTNTPLVEPKPEKKGLFGFGKKTKEVEAAESKE